jgi:hypothetical protein
VISFKVLLAAALAATCCLNAHGEAPQISISPAARHSLLITFDQTVGGRSPHTTHVEMRVPRDLYVIPASKIISFHLHERYANGDESRRNSAGTIGFFALRQRRERHYARNSIG